MAAAAASISARVPAMSVDTADGRRGVPGTRPTASAAAWEGRRLVTGVTNDPEGVRRPPAPSVREGSCRKELLAPTPDALWPG